jgi:predicted aldo/keto reductase-like oxidoreductase
MILLSASKIGSVAVSVVREADDSPRQPRKWRVEYILRNPNVSIVSKWFETIQEVRDHVATIDPGGSWCYYYGEPKPARKAA